LLVVRHVCGGVACGSVGAAASEVSSVQVRIGSKKLTALVIKLRVDFQLRVPWSSLEMRVLLILKLDLPVNALDFASLNRTDLAIVVVAAAPLRPGIRSGLLDHEQAADEDDAQPRRPTAQILIEEVRDLASSQHH